MKVFRYVGAILSEVGYPCLKDISANVYFKNHDIIVSTTYTHGPISIINIIIIT